MKLDMKMMVLNNQSNVLASPTTPELVTSIANDEKQLGNWNPRSLQTFQTFPRSPLPNALKNGGTNGVEKPAVNGNGSSEDPRPRHGHSQSVIETVAPKPATCSETTNGHSTPSHSHSKSALEPIDLHKVVIHSDGSRDVRIFLAPNDRRFGFSVVGGTDEGFNPCIDDISAGSPADRADLEIGDEILEVNGRSLSNCSHTEVISHIHQCIRSRTICLRVKRKSGNRLALDLAQQSNIQDAFVIAVEQQARERLERLSALKKIKPVDMNKLSQQLNLKDTTVSVDVHTPGTGVEVESSANEGCGDEVADLVDTTNPVYNISVPDLTAHQTKAASAKSPGTRAVANSVVSNGRAQNVAESKTESETPSGDLPTLTNGNSEVLLRKQDERVIPIVVGIASRKTLDTNDDDVSVLRTKTEDKDEKTTKAEAKPKPDPVEITHPSMIGLMEMDGPHREMAVDVPEGFMARTKTPPRYPPPKSALTTGKKNGGVGKPPPPPREVASASKAQKPTQRASLNSRTAPSSSPLTGAGSMNRHRAAGGSASGPGPLARNRSADQVDACITSPAPNIDQIERIKKYQEDMARRREEEARRQREEDFLRSSLRGSEKLKALEEPRTPTPAMTMPTDVKGSVNAAFAMDDDVHNQERQTQPPSRPGYREDIGRVVGVTELLECIGRLQHQLRTKHRDAPEVNLSSLQQLVKSEDFQKVLAVHNKVQSIWCLGCPPTPVSDDIQGLVQECVEALEESGLPEAMNLVSVLHKHDLVGLTMAHDEIARREPLPPVSPEEELLDRASQYPESDSVKIVRIEKTNEPLGATIKNEGDAVVIGRIVKGGAAERSGLLREGDEILEVNGIEMRGKNVNEVCDILAAMTGTLTFLISPSSRIDRSHIRTNNEPVMHVKAHFDYDPEEDLFIPCRELGISFQKGDILHVLSQEDPNWWQAYREGEEDQSLAGLIPSKSFQEHIVSLRQETLKHAQFEDGNNRKSKKGTTLLCAKKHGAKNKRKKKLYSAANDDFEPDEILTYEEVGLYYPRANRKRPMVLVGPPNIGRMQLMQMLMERDSDRFATAVAHTSRPRRDGEIDGQDHHFITRAQFESDIMSRKFVDHGEYEKHYYGTSLDAIRNVVSTGKICVCSFHPQSLKNLKNSDLKPFVVFIAPPNLETLKKTRQKMGLPFKDEELKEVVVKARETERKYGHYLDFTLVNVDLERTYQQLIHEINVMEREPQWVPEAWLKNDTDAT